MFTDEDVVTQAQRDQRGLVTYRSYNDEQRADNTIILLTEQGTYKLIMKSQSEVAMSFCTFITKLLKKTRAEEINKLVIGHQKEMVLAKDQMRQAAVIIQTYQKEVPIVQIRRKYIGNDSPHEHVLPSEVDADELKNARQIAARSKKNNKAKHKKREDSASNDDSNNSDDDHDSNDSSDDDCGYDDGPKDKRDYLYRVSKGGIADPELSKYQTYAKVYGAACHTFNICKNPVFITDKAFEYCYYTTSRKEIDKLCNSKAVKVQYIY